MSYVIGNTTVIDNNGALGSVSGNSLNLANNSNISGGGGFTSATSSTTVDVSTLGGAAATTVLIGGGGGAAGPSWNSGINSGGQGGFVVGQVDISPGGNASITVGGGGNRVFNTQNTTNAPSGGTTSISYPNFNQGQAAGGGGGARWGSQSRGNGGQGEGLDGTRFRGYPSYGIGGYPQTNTINNGKAGFMTIMGS